MQAWRYEREREEGVSDHCSGRHKGTRFDRRKPNRAEPTESGGQHVLRQRRARRTCSAIARRQRGPRARRGTG